MAHHTAQREFDMVAFDKSYDGRPRWESSPRTVANAKQKARREGYTNFFVGYCGSNESLPGNITRIMRYVFDPDNGKWIYS